MAVSQFHEGAPQQVEDLCDPLEEYLVNLGDDVTEIADKNHFAFGDWRTPPASRCTLRRRNCRFTSR
jgi:hypothetical protein